VAVVAAVGEVFEAALGDVLEAEAGDGGVVGFDEGDAGDKVRGAEVDGGEVAGADGLGDAGVFDAGDDAVAAPVREPGGRGVAAAVFGEVGAPGAVLADVGDDPVEQAARVGVGGFDEEGDGFAMACRV